MESQPTLKYVLYARKSSEQDERQAMSIDSQIKEMGQIAVRDGVTVLDIRQESHSAKESGQRPELMRLIQDIRDGLFNAILTWAPDRLSRNAGDLGMLVDLMDQGKLLQIKTYSQNFSNNPNEKFLLMILCSQAKLENDQKGQNVKRGIRAKCEMGWRPGPPPIGYYNRTMAGLKDIIEDPDRGYVIEEMFERSKNGHSGRTIRRWFDEIGFTTRKEKQVSLSQIYAMLKNPFYYGEFEYPIGSGKIYKGAHKPLVTKELFDEVQKKLTVVPKSSWGGKLFAFKGIFTCATCGGSVIGEEKMRKRKGREPKRHVYYHCSRKKDYECPERYISEEEMIRELVRYIRLIENVKPQYIQYSKRLATRIEHFKSLRNQVMLTSDIDPDKTKFRFNDYVKYVMQMGTLEEKRDVVLAVDRKMYLHGRMIIGNPVV
ncbi:MAG: recombinase family protein [bacterium]